ncbi:hypothetical protein JTE90_003524 [Oedothorax gibbosus]|uniref:Uncharacterized protein n=1 Tax=Oedothorax gibbosus TaxID=931172 RepID=A0AAV6UQF3_9ARAC|nr:hypothetical protein JTE90_003524 [Oedothorax gibbosus]
MAFQAVTGSPASSPQWQGFGCNKFRDFQVKSGKSKDTELNLVLHSLLNSSLGRKAIRAEEERGESFLLKALSSTMRDTPSMVQKLLEEEREAVKSALQAVDEHMQLKKKEVDEVHRKLMKEEPVKEHFKAAFGGGATDLLKTTARNTRITSSYTPIYNPQPVKIQPQKPIFLEAIFEEDHDTLSHSSNKVEKRQERIRHSAMPSRMSTARSRCSVASARPKDKVTSARPRMPEMSVLPPIDSGWSNVPTDGTYTGPLSYRWQRVADNYIDSDLRVRSRRRCQSRAMETRIRLGYQDDDEQDEEDRLFETEMRIPRKRQITFGPPHSTSYSRWFSHINGLDGHHN